MKLRAIALAAACMSFAPAAFAQDGGVTHTNDMFRGPRLQQSFANSGQPTSHDAILPDGTINVDPSVTGSINSNFSAQPRLQCSSSPNTSEMTTNTFDGAVASNCP